MDNNEELNIGSIMGMMMGIVMLALLSSVVSILPGPRGQLRVSQIVLY